MPGLDVTVAQAQPLRPVPPPANGSARYYPANDINDAGAVVGTYFDVNDNVYHGFRFKAGQYDLIDVQGSPGTFPRGINNNGHVVGYYLDANGDERPFKWVDGLFTTLVFPRPRSGAEDINDAGIVVGWYDDGTTLRSAIVRPTGIETVGSPATLTNLTSINNAGVSVGSGIDAGGSYVNYRYANGVLAPLATPTSPACATPIATSVSDAGTIAGWCLNQAVAFLFSNGIVETLSFPGASQTVFTGMSASGSVAGSATFDDPLGQIYGGIFRHTAHLADPVPDLVGSGTVTELPDELTSLGTLVQGVAADGVARVVVRVPVTSANQPVAVRLLNDHVPRTLSTSAQEDGALLALDAQSSPVSQLTVNAVATNDGPTAFLLYRAPKDFPREGVPAAPGAFGPDDLKASRRVFLEITPQGESSYIKAVEVVRPPVFLIHGLWSGPRSWFGFLPLRQGTDPRFRIDSADYSGNVTVTSTVPPFSSDDLPRLTAASLGAAYNSPFVKDDMQKALERFRVGVNPMRLPMAAAQTDVVGHSLGGVVARTIATLPDFLRASNFNAGSIHKLVTIDTPHLGSPLAAELLATRNTCLRTFIASTHFVFIGLSNFSIVQATLPDDTVVDGAVGDLVANPLSPALQRITASAMADVPTAFVAGKYERWSALDGLGSEDYIKLRCGSEWLASRLTSAGWPTIFNGERNDAIVGWSSQINGVEDDAVHPFSDKVHSAGTRALGFAGPSIQDGGPVPVEVTRILNTPVYASTFFRPKP